MSPVEKRLKVEIDKAQVNKKLDDSYRQLGRQVNIKGFRPGKAPRSLLESMFGKRWFRTLPASWSTRRSATSSVSRRCESSASPCLKNSPTRKKDQDLRYSARIELMPQIEVKDYEGIAVQKREGKVTDEQVNAALESRRQSQQRAEAGRRP